MVMQLGQLLNPRRNPKMIAVNTLTNITSVLGVADYVNTVLASLSPPSSWRDDL
jgi:hypothetical protein